MTTEAEPDPSAETPQAGRWADNPALWAQRHADPESLRRSFVTFTGPELNAHQMVGLAEMAGIAGIAASTLRSYIVRGEADVPLPLGRPQRPQRMGEARC